MSKLVEFPVQSDGTSVVIEVEDTAAGPVPVGIQPGQVARAASDGLEAALDRIRPIASTALERMRDLDEPPDEVTIDFGVKFSADLGAILAKAGSEANLHVALKWSRAAHARSQPPAELAAQTR